MEKTNLEENKKKKKTSDKKVSTSKKEENPIESVIIRNESLYSIYRKLIALSLITFIAVIIAIISTIQIYKMKVPPRYIPLDVENRLLPTVPLDKPNITNGEVGQLALEAVKAINTYDYINWKEELEKTEVYFTPKGWNAYWDQFKLIGTLNTITSQKMIVSIDITSNMTVPHQKVVNGIYTWLVEIPVKITYYAHRKDAPGNNIQTGKIILQIERVPTTINPTGAAISSYIFNETK